MGEIQGSLGGTDLREFADAQRNAPVVLSPSVDAHGGKYARLHRALTLRLLLCGTSDSSWMPG